MPWIESHQELRNHPKTKRLARELKITVAAAIGHLHCLWWWATDYAPDGDLTEYEAWEIADAAYYEGKNTEKFKDALIFAGFLDNTNGRLILHDWNDYGGKNLNRQKKATERVQRYRERQRAVQQQCNANETEQSRTVSGQTEGNAQECNGNVTVTQALQNANETQKKRKRNCVTGHDMTRQDITGQESTGKENTDTPHNPPEGGSVGQDRQPTLQERRFAEFWSVYPRKEGKGAAEKAWNKIRPTAELHAAILAKVKANVDGNPQWHRDNGKYIPHPATWLNQKRWEDEIPKAPQMNGGGYHDAGSREADAGFQRSTGFRRADTDTGPDG